MESRLSLPLVLTDQDLLDSTYMSVAIGAVRNFMSERAAGQAVAPPRHHVKFGDHGDLVFTVGGIAGNQPIAGFRAYETFRGKDHTQLVAVWSPEGAQLQGIVLGRRLGALRTGAIGGLAIDQLSSPDARTVGVIGSGPQARAQLAAAVAVRNVTKGFVFSRDARNRERFAQEMQLELGIEIIPVASVDEAVCEADIVISATSSQTPVLSAVQLKPGAHVNALGPKTAEACDIDIDIARLAGVIATDSMDQLRASASPFFLDGTELSHSVAELSDIVADKAAGRTSETETTLFCSAGLAGTEVAVAAAIFQAKTSQSRQS